MEQVKKDFSEVASEGYGIAEVIRTVACLNSSLSQKEFVAIAIECGYNKSTASIQFRKSRRLDAELEAM